MEQINFKRFISTAICFIALIAMTSIVYAQNPGRPRQFGPEDIAGPVQPNQAIPPAVPEKIDANEKLYTPFSSIELAAQDISNLYKAGVDTSYIRYISLYNMTKARRDYYFRLVSFSINSLSRGRLPILPSVVDGSDGTLIRLVLTDYLIDVKAWELLAEKGSGRSPLREPYFTAAYEELITVEKQEYLQDEFGRYLRYANGQYAYKTVKVQEKKQIVGPAPWVQLDSGKSVQLLTLYAKTQYPVMRGDWFVTYALWAPRYYDFLGLGEKESDFEKLLLVDNDRTGKVKIAGIIAANKERQVALNNRFITRIPTVSGIFSSYYWKTYDTKKSTDNRTYLNNIIDIAKAKNADGRFDATEIIGGLPNGLQAYWLGDGAGNRVDKADADVAQDSITPLQDHQVWSARNCIGCHVEGIRPYTESVRSLSRVKLTNLEHIKLLIVDTDPELSNSKLVQSLFSIDLAPVMKFDQSLYEAAIQTTTRGPNGEKGWTSGELAVAFRNANHEYLDVPIYINQIALDVGMHPDKIISALKKGKGLDYTLTGLLDNPPEPIRRDNYENNSFPQLMQYLEPFRE